MAALCMFSAMVYVLSVVQAVQGIHSPPPRPAPHPALTPRLLPPRPQPLPYSPPPPPPSPFSPISSSDMQAALNIDNSVSRVGLYGSHDEKLWCLSYTETLHLWEWVAACDEESAGVLFVS